MTKGRQLGIVLLTAAILGAALSAWLTSQFARENLGGDFFDLDTGEMHFSAIASVFVSMAGIFAVPLALVGSVGVLVVQGLRRRGKVR